MGLSPVVIIDNGSGFTKVGFAGSAEPQSIFQSAIGRRVQKGKDSPLNDLEFVTGDDTLRPFGSTYESTFPVKHGIVEDWNAMEHLWQTCFYDKLQCNTEDHPVLLTETPLNNPEHREQAAEIMFETFNVPALNISVQAVLSLASSWTNEKVVAKELTGTVIDSGYGSTQIIPVVDGHVMSSCIEQIDIGGRDVTAYIQQLMRERKEPIPSDMGVETARAIKERFAYTCPNIEKELFQVTWESRQQGRSRNDSRTRVQTLKRNAQSLIPTLRSTSSCTRASTRRQENLGRAMLNMRDSLLQKL
jgi:actin-related protein 3